MTVSDFKNLVSTENLMLAWNRVSTAANLTYKRYFRPVFYAYEFASVDLPVRFTVSKIASKKQCKSSRQ
jgi:hypothetical protein